MITNAILTVFSDLLHGLLSVIPAISVPSWLSGQSGPIATVFQDAGLMSVWFPVTLAVTVIGAVLAIWLAGFAVKIARMCVSLFTGGGGSAA